MTNALLGTKSSSTPKASKRKPARSKETAPVNQEVKLDRSKSTCRDVQQKHRLKQKLYFDNLVMSNTNMQRQATAMTRNATGLNVLVLRVLSAAVSERMRIVEEFYEAVGSKSSEYNGTRLHAFLEKHTTEHFVASTDMHRDELEQQFQLCRTLYENVYYEVQKVDVIGSEKDIFRIDLTGHFQLAERSLKYLYPGILDFPKVAQACVGQWIAVPMVQTFYFETSFIAQMDIQSDFISAWVHAVGLKPAVQIMKTANLSPNSFIKLTASTLNDALLAQLNSS